MTTQMTVRLPEELNDEVRGMAKRLRLKRSDIVRLALERFVKEAGEGATPFEKVKSLIGSISSGAPDLGESHRKHLMARIKKYA